MKYKRFLEDDGLFGQVASAVNMLPKNAIIGVILDEDFTDARSISMSLKDLAGIERLSIRRKLKHILKGL